MQESCASKSDADTPPTSITKSAGVLPFARPALIRTPLEGRRHRSFQLPGKETPPLAKVISHLRLPERLEVAPPVLSATPVGCGTPKYPAANSILGDTGLDVTKSRGQN